MIRATVKWQDTIVMSIMVVDTGVHEVKCMMQHQ